MENACSISFPMSSDCTLQSRVYHFVMRTYNMSIFAKKRAVSDCGEREKKLSALSDQSDATWNGGTRVWPHSPFLQKF